VIFAGAALAFSALVGSVVPLLVALLGLLSWLVVVRRGRRQAAHGRGSVELKTPWRLALAVFVTSVFGALLASVLAVVLNGLRIGGGGRLLLEVLLAIFVLTPAFLLGRRCPHWWAFAGSFPFWFLLAIRPSLTLLTFVTAIACSLALGSLGCARVEATRAGHRQRRARPERVRDEDERFKQSLGQPSVEAALAAARPVKGRP
jgi:hypothetical protein